MTLADGLPARLTARLERGRAIEGARQLDTCRITKPGDGEPQMNNETLELEPPAPGVVYEGPCRIPRRDSQGQGATSRAGEAAWQVGEYPLNLPFTAASAEVRVGMTVTYLTAAHDTALVGNVYGITAVADSSQATARRFRMKRVTGE